jgi:hypothetical protein
VVSYGLIRLKSAHDDVHDDKAGVEAASGAVVAALTAFPKHVDVQHQGLWALMQMPRLGLEERRSDYGWCSIIASNAKVLSEDAAAILDVIASALTSGALGRSVHLVACDALAQLTNSVSADEVVVAGIEALLSMLRTHPNDALVQKSGFEVLDSLCFFERGAIAALSAAAGDTTKNVVVIDIIKAVVAALTAHTSLHEEHVAEMQRAGCRALLRLASVENVGEHDAAAAAADAGAMDVLVAVLQQASIAKSKTVVASASAALARVLRGASLPQLAHARSSLGAEGALQAALSNLDSCDRHQVSKALADLKRQDDAGGVAVGASATATAALTAKTYY